MCKNCENGKVLKAKQNESVLAVIFISFIQTKMTIFKPFKYSPIRCLYVQIARIETVGFMWRLQKKMLRPSVNLFNTWAEWTASKQKSSEHKFFADRYLEDVKYVTRLLK